MATTKTATISTRIPTTLHRDIRLSVREWGYLSLADYLRDVIRADLKNRHNQ